MGTPSPARLLAALRAASRRWLVSCFAGELTRLLAGRGVPPLPHQLVESIEGGGGGATAPLAQPGRSPTPP
jgi:hypothetical protein